MKKLVFVTSLLLSMAMSSTTAYAVSVWNGGVDTEWATNASGHYLIYTADELAGLASQVKAGNTYSGATFLLMDDIDLNNYQKWFPIGYMSGTGAGGTFTGGGQFFFSGVFDGQNHTVSHYYAHSTAPLETTTVGLFGAINGATIKNLHVSDSYAYVNTNHYYNYGGSIVGYSKSGIITNCSATGNTIEVYSPFNFLSWAVGTAYAGGICGASGETVVTSNSFQANTNTTISGCTVAGNSVTAKGNKSNSTYPQDITTGANKSENKVYGSKAEMSADIAAINRATIIYNNFGVGNTPKTPYYLDVNTGMPTDIIYYALLVDNSRAEAGSVRSNAQVLEYPNKKDFEYNGAMYALFTPQTVVPIEFYLEGFSGNWSNAGYYINEITDSNGNVVPATLVYQMQENGLDENNNSTYSYATDRFMRKLRYEITMPASLMQLSYTTTANIGTGVADAEVQAIRIYGAMGEVVIESAVSARVVIADMTGRIVYNACVSEGRNTVALAPGFYIVNGTKVVVR